VWKQREEGGGAEEDLSVYRLLQWVEDSGEWDKVGVMEENNSQEGQALAGSSLSWARREDVNWKIR